MKSPFIIAATATLMLPTMTNAAEIKVLSTQATEETYRELAPQFEKATGHKVTTIFTGTLGVQKRLAAGESYDMIIMAGPAIDEQIKAGKVVAGSCQIRRCSRRPEGCSQARHQHHRGAKENRAGGQVDRLFHRPKRRLYH